MKPQFSEVNVLWKSIISGGFKQPGYDEVYPPGESSGKKGYGRAHFAFPPTDSSGLECKYCGVLSIVPQELKISSSIIYIIFL